MFISLFICFMTFPTISECPSSYKRFGDHCYFERMDVDILTNADACENEGAVLWYPETSAEIAFVRFVLKGTQ